MESKDSSYQQYDYDFKTIWEISIIFKSNKTIKHIKIINNKKEDNDMTTQLLTANDLQQLARLTKLNDLKLKDFLIDVGLHRATSSSKALGYSSPYMIYHWLKWSKDKLPIINDLYSNKVDLRKDPELLEQIANEVIDNINELKGQLSLFFN